MTFINASIIRVKVLTTAQHMDFFRGGVFDCFVIVNDCVRGPCHRITAEAVTALTRGPVRCVVCIFNSVVLPV